MNVWMTQPGLNWRLGRFRRTADPELVRHDAGVGWFKSRRRQPARLSTLTSTGIGEPVWVTAEQRGNVTDAHRALLIELSPDQNGEWSTRALWACLEELRHSVITEASEVRVHDAWTDGSDAFCVVYAPPYQPDEHVGIRRHADDQDVPVSYGIGSQLFREHGSEPADTARPVDPIAFGVSVAAFDIGEPLGSYYERLDRDDQGIGWWGSIDGVLPQHGILP